MSNWRGKLGAGLAARRRTRRGGGHGGAAFTLVELVAVMVVLGVIGTISVATVQRAAVASTQVGQRAQLTSEASMALDRIVQMVKYTPQRAATTATPALSYVDGDEIVWENGDELDVPTGAPTTMLLRSVRDGDAPGSAARLLARDMLSFTIVPLNDNGQNLFTVHGTTTLNTPALTADVHSMTLTLSLQRAGLTVTLGTRVFLRANAELGAP